EVPVSEREQMIGDITEITGKWPALVYALGSHLSEYPLSRWPSALKERNGIVTAIGGPDLFGLGEGAVTEVLNALHTFERASADELATLLERDLNDVERTLAWAERLAMTERLSDGTWIV